MTFTSLSYGIKWIIARLWDQTPNGERTPKRIVQKSPDLMIYDAIFFFLSLLIICNCTIRGSQIIESIHWFFGSENCQSAVCHVIDKDIIRHLFIVVSSYCYIIRFIPWLISVIFISSRQPRRHDKTKELAIISLSVTNRIQKIIKWGS